MNISAVDDVKAPSLGTRAVQSVRRNIQTYTLLIAVVVIWVIFFFATHGKYLDPQNISNLFRQMAVTSFLAIGMVLVIVTGSIDLSVGKLAGFVSVVAAYLQFYVWFKLSSGSGGPAGHTFCHLRPAGWPVGWRSPGLYHCLFGFTCFHCDPGRSVAVQWSHPAGYPGQNHCGESTGVF